jgi:two-component system OmpR family sensor kinase
VSLSARLSAFFLAALGVVLLGFSAGLFLLARAYLHRQTGERLTAALDALAAATEEDDEGLEWEPREHHLSVGQDAAADQVRWEVRDATGALLDHSANLGPDGTLSAGGPAPWQLAQRRLEASSPHIGAGRYRALVLTAGLSPAPARATLSTLALALAGLTAVLWLTAALAGRWMCRRALVPVTRMAAAARAMDAADLRRRLPSPGTGDELEELRGAFNDLLTRVETALTRQRRFTGDASHQLRTPLTAMLGQVEVALRRDRPAEDYRQVLEHVHGQAVHLRRIVEALLFLARADADADLPGLEVLDLTAWLPGQIVVWSEHPRAADLRIGGVPAGPLRVRAQPLLLGQLLENLVDNALKYSDPGTPVVVSLAEEAGTVTLVVEDAGCGIAAEHLPHVFEPFYRAAPGRRGVGLGLAMVQRIAAAFGGEVGVTSTPGRGSRFVLRLPCALPGPIAAQAMTSRIGSAPSTPTSFWSRPL